jgi:bifunctional non-homologous end joining protein LigD
MAAARSKDRLETYRAKRRAGGTPEPFGGGAARPRLFVVQKHAATRLHWDFRLECGGTLWSWAVPHGPSLDPRDRRLAVHVEDHPVEYADFEGVIPPGHYGAGAVIVWDRGTWVPHDDPDAGLAAGKLHFDLHGSKMKGEWILVRTQRGPKDWLLFKKADAYAAAPGTPPFDERSILSGLTVEELRDGTSRGVALRERLAASGAVRRRVDPRQVKLMLAATAAGPFSSHDWIFELKYDGYRMVAARRDGAPLLLYRSGLDATALYPEIASTLRALPWDGVVLDGELVALDEQGRPDFQRLQRRSRLRRRAEIERAAVEQPAVLFVFDLLGFEAWDLRGLPLGERKGFLRDVLPPAGALRYADHVEERGAEMFTEVRRLGLEGLLAKRRDSTYQGRRSSHWLKIVADHTGDFVVVGFTAPQGSRSGFGALHLAAWAEGVLLYCGSVGSGFDAAHLEGLHAALAAARTAEPACTGVVPAGRGHTWVRPEHVVEVRYKTWTEGGHLRHPVFARLRDDKKPEDCEHPRPRVATIEPVAAAEARAEERPAAAPRPGAAAAAAPGTRLEKVFWPREKYTKGDLLEYYRTIAPWILPYLRDRPLVVTRFPDGIEGKSFYQKNAPDHVPDWVRRERIWSEHSEREIDYFVCDDVETLLYIANLGAIPLHVWSSRTPTIQRPDWCILDLDPKGAPFLHVVELARALHDLCDDIGLPSHVKTSGSTGLHVLVPLGGQCTYEQSRKLAHLLVRLVHQERPEISTIARALTARRGKVYLDWLQNRHGQLLAAPFCVRPLPRAPVSTPLRWSEVTPKLDIGRFTIRTVPERLRRAGEDPLLPILHERPDLVAALQRLAARLEPPAPPRRRR